MRISQIELVKAIMKEIGRQEPKGAVAARHFNAVINAANRIVAEFAKNEIKAGHGIGIDAWRQTDQVCLSSDYMASVLGKSGVRRYAYPHDPSDFGRCLTLLDAVPKLRENLHEMKNTGKEWEVLIDNWEYLELLYREESPTGKAPKLFKKMQSLLQKAQKRKGD